MKITLMFTGKTEERYLQEGIDIYSKRIRRYIPHEISITGERKKKSLHQAGKFPARGERLPSPGNNTFTVLLDEKGEKFSSVDFAKFLEKIMTHGYKELIFITGGAYGFPEGAAETADKLVSLSDMTFSHQMVRLILIEQVYRAMTIIRGEPYHHQ